MQFQSLTAKGSNVRGEASSYYVATVSQRMDNPEAYAELFAAAPDMLAALKLVAPLWPLESIPVGAEHLPYAKTARAIRAAIAKAEGR